MSADDAAALDHLVIAAVSLDSGTAWCERTFGIVPAAGGTHALMGTHNRVFSIATPGFPRCYAEIIAIDPAAPPPSRPRWFGLDDFRGEPRLVHWVMRTARLDALRDRMRAAGADPGPALECSRASAAGPLRWRLTVRDDGAVLQQGAAPSLIEWASAHPADALPPQGVALLGLGAGDGPWPDVPGIERGSPAGLAARFSTPRGIVTLPGPHQSHRS